MPLTQFLTLLLAWPLFAHVQQIGEAEKTLYDSPAKRRAAVEESLLPRTWVEDHAFGMTERMRILGVPGVSVAVIHDGKIDWAAGYGVRDTVTGEPVTAETLFQAASISKSISALGTLRLAQEGRLDLDAPISDFMSSYELSEVDFEGAVTPRRILSHTAGLSVHGFAGYRTDEALPSAVEVVKGLGNSGQVRRIESAGTRVRYSGGGSALLQVGLVDLLGTDFAGIMREKVLDPLEMKHSTFEQPLPTGAWSNYSAAHNQMGRQVSGGFHVYPEQFPAGLWTTPSDIARFALEVQRFAASRDGDVLDAEWGQAMLTPELDRAALGLFLAEHGGEPWFSHSGANEGFRCDFRASFRGGRGVVVMTNGSMGAEVCQDVIRAVAKVYGWPGVVGEPLGEARLAPDQLARYAGRYALSPGEVVFVSTANERLTLQQPPYPELSLAHLGNHRFQILGSDYQVEFQGDPTGVATSLSMSMEPDRRASRVAPDKYLAVQGLLEGDVEEAVAYYRDVFEANPTDPVVDCDSLVGLSAWLLNDGRAHAALTLARAIVDFYPGDAEAWDALGRAHSEVGALGAAADAYRSCLAHIESDESVSAGHRVWLKTNAEARLRWLTETRHLMALRERAEYAELDRAEVEAVAHAAGSRWPNEFSGFTYQRVERFSAGGVSHWISIWTHKATELEFALVPGGRFQMGSPADEIGRRDDESQHWLTLDPFLVARTECTRGAWAKVLTPSTPLEGVEVESEQLPISGIGPLDVEAWCREAGLNFPTEAQWEFMCRAGTTSAWTMGDDKGELVRFANLGSAECPEDWVAMAGITEPWYDGFGMTTADVSSFACNAFGLFDVHGNLVEWCRDEYFSYDVSPAIGTGARLGTSNERQARGGNFGGDASAARSAKRLACGPGASAEGTTNHGFGFRPSLDLPF